MTDQPKHPHVCWDTHHKVTEQGDGQYRMTSNSISLRTEHAFCRDIVEKRIIQLSCRHFRSGSSRWWRPSNVHSGHRFSKNFSLLIFVWKRFRYQGVFSKSLRHLQVGFVAELVTQTFHTNCPHSKTNTSQANSLICINDAWTLKQIYITHKLYITQPKITITLPQRTSKSVQLTTSSVLRPSIQVRKNLSCWSDFTKLKIMYLFYYLLFSSTAIHDPFIIFATL